MSNTSNIDNKSSIKKIKIDLVLNLVICGLVIMATIFMMTGFKFMGDDIELTATKVEVFKFFTVDSNILMGIMAIVFAKFEIDLINNKRTEIPRIIYMFKLAATVGVVLTFLVTACFLAVITKTGYFTLFKNSNLFFHFIIPVLSFISFTCFEKTKVLTFKDSFAGLIPMFIYAIYYTINVLSHLENGKVSVKYDWYWFLQGGIGSIIFVIPIMFLVTYAICYTTWKLNRKQKYN